MRRADRNITFTPAAPSVPLPRETEHHDNPKTEIKDEYKATPPRPTVVRTRLRHLQLRHILTDLSIRREVFTASLQSILYFPEAEPDACYVGRQAEEKYVAEAMKGRLLKSVKTLLKQDKFLFTWINGKKVTPDQMATHIIRALKEQAEAYLGHPIRKVTLGRPAVFSEKEQEEKTAVARLLTAAHNAGFEEVHLQLEPIAAALRQQSRIECSFLTIFKSVKKSYRGVWFWIN